MAEDTGATLSVVNPATVLARIIASLHDHDWHVAVPGFYDDVDSAEAFRDKLAAVPFDEATFRAETGAGALDGEAGHSTLERLWVRPTLEVNGLLSGYVGEGPKTVLPSKAMAKISCRLVPDQDPGRVRELLEDHVRRIVPRGVSATIRTLQAGLPWRSGLEGPLYAAAERALEGVFGRTPVMAGEGGSIPIVADFERVLGAPVLLMGFGLPGQNAHAPDEWFSLENYRRGIRAAASLLEEIPGAFTS
jgi:acetylornithine deacetylase/succinyl-diaminopimelate desuccinylase-like protein